MANTSGPLKNIQQSLLGNIGDSLMFNICILDAGATKNIGKQKDFIAHNLYRFLCFTLKIVLYATFSPTPRVLPEAEFMNVQFR